MHGVAIVGRPVSRYLDNGFIAEVTKLCTDETKNTCSFLYSKCAKICKLIGYERIQTYIFESESWISLKASGWIFDKICGAGNWNVKSRPRKDSLNTEKKRLYYKNL